MPTQMIVDLTLLLAYLTSWDEQGGGVEPHWLTPVGLHPPADFGRPAPVDFSQAPQYDGTALGSP